MDITRVLINHLKRLSTGDVKPINESWGVCYELSRKFDIMYNELYTYFEKWPKFSGNFEFPVPANIENKSAKDLFYEIENLWVDNNDYNNLRLELCLFLALEFEKEIVNSD